MLFRSLNNLEDSGGQSVDVIIEPVDDLKTDYYGTNTEFGNATEADGLAQTTPNINYGDYYSVRSKHGQNTVSIALNSGLYDPGLTLSHEGGHVTYNVAFLKYYYLIWVKNKPKGSRGGHGGGNPSGKEAERQEDIYRKNKK